MACSANRRQPRRTAPHHANDRRICYNSTMPESPFDGKHTTQKPLPQCKAFLICERVGIDVASGQFNLYNIVNSLASPQFPADLRPLVAFLQLYLLMPRLQMRNDEKQENASDVPKESPKSNDESSQRNVRMITSNDVGWIGPTAFVAPITLVPIDPPRPLNRRGPQSA